MKTFRASKLEAPVMPAGVADATGAIPCGVIIGQVIAQILNKLPK